MKTYDPNPSKRWDFSFERGKSGYLTICGIILLAILAAALYLRFGGMTHERIYDKVIDESDEIQERIDDRYRALDQKLDRIEGKLDKILEIANRPMPDNLKPAQSKGLE